MTTTNVVCSVCGSTLEYLGGVADMFGPRASVLSSEGGAMNALDQWRGNVCVACGAIYCGQCIELGGPTACPKCGKPTYPAQRQYLDQASSDAHSVADLPTSSPARKASDGTASAGGPADAQAARADASDPWIAGLRDGDSFRRAECAIRLGERKDETAVDELIEALRTEGTVFTAAALAQSLGRIGARRALPVLRETLESLRDDAVTPLCLMAWSTSVMRKNILPDTFADLDEATGGLYHTEQTAMRTDLGAGSQIFIALTGIYRRKYVFQSIFMAMAEVGEWADIDTIAVFLTWRWKNIAVLEAHTCAAEAMAILLDRLPVVEERYHELGKLRSIVLQSRQFAAREGWNTTADTDKALSAIARKRHAVRKKMRSRIPTWRGRMWDRIKEVFQG